MSDPDPQVVEGKRVLGIVPGMPATGERKVPDDQDLVMTSPHLLVRHAVAALVVLVIVLLVSLAFDLAHTRPHRAKVVFNKAGEVIVGEDLVDSSSPRVKLLTKTLRSPLDEFEKRVESNLAGLFRHDSTEMQPMRR